ncbi:hypothetical protein RFI_16646, partial [Reticulomyxa filosa]
NIPVHTVNEPLQHKDLNKILESYRDAKYLEAHQQIRLKNVQFRFKSKAVKKKKKISKQWELVLNDPKFLKVVSSIRKTKCAPDSSSSLSPTPTPNPTPPPPSPPPLLLSSITTTTTTTITTMIMTSTPTQTLHLPQINSPTLTGNYDGEEKDAIQKPSPLDWAIFHFEQVRRGVKRMAVESTSSAIAC